MMVAALHDGEKHDGKKSHVFSHLLVLDLTPPLRGALCKPVVSLT